MAKRRRRRHSESWIPRAQYRQQQRAKEFGVEQPYFTPAMKRRVKKQFLGRCFNCGSTPKRLHIDHHRPLSAGFPIEYGNAVVLCASCNCSKGTKMPEEFYTVEQLLILTKLLDEQRSWASK